MEYKITTILNAIEKKLDYRQVRTLKFCFETVDNTKQSEQVRQQAIKRAAEIDINYSRYLDMLNKDHYKVNLSGEMAFSLGLNQFTF